MAEHIPDDVIVHILERLPIKSLLRFTCVSKWWRSIILYDHQFAKSQFQRAYETSPTRHILSTSSNTEFESIDTEMPLTSGSVSKLTCPSEFKQPNHVVRILSCNGLILASTIDTRKYRLASKFHIWNPLTGFFKKLPDSRNIQCVDAVGFGHLSATDDYKVIVSIQKNENFRWVYSEAEIFSLRDNTWKTIRFPSNVEISGKGFLVNEAIHWILYPYYINVVAFDLAKEEFRTIPLPTNLQRPATLPASPFKECLCIFEYASSNLTGDYFDFWVMREYDMADSWTKLFNIMVNNIPFRHFTPFLVTESSTFLHSFMRDDEQEIKSMFIKGVHHQEDVVFEGSVFETYTVGGTCGGDDFYFSDAIKFKESLLWLR